MFDNTIMNDTNLLKKNTQTNKYHQQSIFIACFLSILLLLLPFVLRWVWSFKNMANNQVICIWMHILYVCYNAYIHIAYMHINSCIYVHLEAYQVALMVNNPPAIEWDLTCRFDPWVRSIPWRRAWQSTSESLPGESHGQRSLVGYSPQGLKESDKTEAT